MNRLGLFRYGRTNFAIPLSRLQKILHGQQVYLLPQLPTGVWGVLVDDGQIVPVLDLQEIVSETSGAIQAEYMVLTESECGPLAIPANLTFGIVAEKNGVNTSAKEDGPTWVVEQFLFQDKTFQILDIDFLAIGLTQGSW